MQSASRNQLARNVAATLSAPSVSIEGFAPTARNLEPGQDVQFITSLSNNTSQERWVQVFVMLDGVAVAIDQYTLNPDQSRDIAMTRSYEDLTVDRSPGSYPLSVQVQVGQLGSEYHEESWDDLTLVDPNADDGDDDDSNNDDGGDENDNNTDPVAELPTTYLLAGGGAFLGLLFLIVLL